MGKKTKNLKVGKPLPSPKNTLKNYFQTNEKKVDTRPFCKYGETCYQKNEDHLKKYNHGSVNQEKALEKTIEKFESNESTKKRKAPSYSISPSESDEDESNKDTLRTKKIKRSLRNKSNVNSQDDDDLENNSDVSDDDKLKIKANIEKISKEQQEVDVGLKENHSSNSDDDESTMVEIPKKAKSEMEFLKSSNHRNNKSTSKKKTDKKDLRESEIKPSDIENIFRNIYGVDGMPTDFYHFWKFCSTVTPSDPTLALKDAMGFKLVGPFEILLNPEDFQTDDEEKNEKMLCKYRSYYDPPEFQTCIVSLNHEDAAMLKDEKLFGFHLGYYRDDPHSKSSFVALNTPGVQYSSASYKIQPMGDNLFGAIFSEIAHRLQQIPKTDTKRYGLEKLKNRMKKFLSDRDLTSKYSLDRKTEAMKLRQKTVVAKCFHGAGISVSLDANNVGYRELPESDSTLLKIFTKITNNKDNAKKNIDDIMAPVQEIITLVQFANDECDFGMGLEFGHDLFSYGDPILHSRIKHILPLAYDLLNRSSYSRVLVAHLKHRNKMCGSSHWCSKQE